MNDRNGRPLAIGETVLTRFNGKEPPLYATGVVEELVEAGRPFLRGGGAVRTPKVFPQAPSPDALKRLESVGMHTTPGSPIATNTYPGDLVVILVDRDFAVINRMQPDHDLAEPCEWLGKPADESACECPVRIWAPASEVEAF